MQPASKNQLNRQKQRAKSVVWAELLFVFLPLIVMAMILSYKENLSKILLIPEWSFATAVLTGQAIVKFVAGLVHREKKPPWQKVVLPLSILIVMILVPSLILLALILLSEEPPKSLIVGQFILFFLSVIVSLTFGGLGEEYHEEVSQKS